MLRDPTVLRLRQPDAIDDPLSELAREGARRMLAQALIAEADAFIALWKDVKLPDGRDRVVRHGHGPQRAIQTGVGPVEVRRAKVRDRGEVGTEAKIRFTSSILPKWARRTKSLEHLAIQQLYWCRLAKKTKDGPQARRLLALAAIYDGATRTEAAKIGGVGLQIIRDWVIRFNASGPIGLLNGKAPGQPSKLNDAQRQVIARTIESGPIPAVHGVVRWRLIDLAQWIFEEFRITIAKQTLSRELRAMGYRKLSARPRHHAQAEGVIEDFKKASQRAWMKSRAKRQSTSRQ